MYYVLIYFHLESRGYLLELLVTKLLYLLKDKIQIVGMSATLPNIDVLARWLDAALFVTDFRPVPLKEYIKCGDVIESVEDGTIRKLEYDKDPRDPDMLVPLIWETVHQQNSVLVFCSTKDTCERVAR